MKIALLLAFWQSKAVFVLNKCEKYYHYYVSKQIESRAICLVEESILRIVEYYTT